LNSRVIRRSVPTVLGREPRSAAVGTSSVYDRPGVLAQLSASLSFNLTLPGSGNGSAGMPRLCSTSSVLRNGALVPVK
jgi:hypothetical protein